MVSQLVNSTINLIHLRLKVSCDIVRQPVMVRDSQKQAHGVAGKIRKTTGPSDRREATQFIVFRLRKADADHPRSRLQHFHGISVDEQVEFAVRLGRLRLPQSHSPGTYTSTGIGENRTGKAAIEESQPETIDLSGEVESHSKMSHLYISTKRMYVK